MAPGNILTTSEGARWQLVQYHFHSPSEHALDNRHASMEAHLVHMNLQTGALRPVLRASKDVDMSQAELVISQVSGVERLPLRCKA